MWKRLLLGLAIAALILVLLARRLDTAAVWAALADARWELLLLAQLVQFASLWLKAERWVLAIAAGHNVPRRRAFVALVIGTAGNLLLPARLGDFAKALVLRRHHDLPVSRSLVAAWSVQVLDLLAATAILLCLGSALISRGLLFAVLAAGLLALLAMGLAHRFADASARIERALLPAFLGRTLHGAIARAREGLSFLGHGRTLLLVLALTPAVWACDTLAMLISLRAFGITPGPGPAALLVAAVGVSFALPLTPGNVGVFQAISLLVLGAFGVQRDRAFAFALGSQGFSLLVTVVLGLVLLQREGLELRSLSAGPDTAPPEA